MAYQPKQAEFQQFCRRKRYQDGDTVTEDKLLLFLVEEVSKRPLRPQPRPRKQKQKQKQKLSIEVEAEVEAKAEGRGFTSAPCMAVGPRLRFRYYRPL